MKSKFGALTAVLLAVFVFLAGCSANSGSSSASAGSTVADTSGGKSEDASQTAVTEPVEIETPAGAVLVGKIRKDAEGWYFEPEQPLNIKLTCYFEFTPTYDGLKRIKMFDDSDDGMNKNIYRDDIVTVTGMLQNYRDNVDELYLYPCKIEHGKTVAGSFAMPELDYPPAGSADYDPSVPLPKKMQPTVKNGYYEYNPYMLSENTLEYLGNGFADFYVGFVDAWLSYKTSCPCSDKNYADMFLSVMYYEFPLFTADGEYDFLTGYDEKTNTLNWSYKSKDKSEHDKLISDFSAAANKFLSKAKASDSEQLRAEALYHAFCMSMTYDYDIMETRERIEAYYAYTLNRGVCVTFASALSQLFTQIGVKSTLVSGDATAGAHAWNVITLGGKNYFCDSTYELSVNSGSSYSYFGMTMNDRLNDGSGFSKDSIVIGTLNIKSADEVEISEKALQIK